MTDNADQLGQTLPYHVLYPGDEGEPVVVIDDFFSSPDALQEQAARQDYAPGGRHYPGHRAPAPSGYLAERIDLLQDILTDVFDMEAGARLVECNFSRVTTPPDELTPIQCLPHFDGTNPGFVALLHYLSGPEYGGTSFYRHCSTGFETISADRFDIYDRTLQAEANAIGLPPQRYFSGSTDQFEQIGQVEARVNRMVLYRGLCLHSGDIPRADYIGEPDEEARLTVNTFLVARNR
ncbi:DUF6445 family protein [Henriciella aquimarina]|uniref:DUF6445 family protein n=1 Tax=Henriciella aquimarina TaxID=545261 RepID=UPI0009FE194E|nr:DUF6445 family protein [Henriciella aquimarina]